MPCNPTQLWNRLSPTWQTRLRADLTALLQEVIDAQCRPHYASPFNIDIARRAATLSIHDRHTCIRLLSAVSL